VTRESTLHCKLDSQLHWAAVRSIFWAGGKWKMEIPVQSQKGNSSFYWNPFELVQIDRLEKIPLGA